MRALRFLHRSVARLGVLLLTLSVCACERGCLAQRLEGLGARREAQAGPGEVLLSGTDCSDGLARCRDGIVEVSAAAHIPYPCQGGEKACACPWVTVGHCAVGCAGDGVEASIADRADAEILLCRPPPAAPVLRPALPAEVVAGVCATADEVRCEGGVVRVCQETGTPIRTLGVCLHGCAHGVTSSPDELLTVDGSAMILCQRSREAAH